MLPRPPSSSRPQPSRTIVRKNAADQKIKRKAAASLPLELEPTDDILAELGRQKSPKQILIGFAAETQNVLENARQSCWRNPSTPSSSTMSREPGIGFDSERNAVTIITQHDVIDVPESSKWDVAQRVIEAAIKLRAQHNKPSLASS